MTIRDDIHDALHEWIRLATELDAEQIVPVPLGEDPEPVGLWFGINVLPQVGRLGMMDDKEYDGNLEQYTLTSHRERLVSIHARGPGAHEAMAFVEACPDAPSIKKVFADALLVLVETRPIRDLSGPKNGRTEERAQMDVLIRYGQQITDDTPAVAGVEYEIQIGADSVTESPTF